MTQKEIESFDSFRAVCRKQKKLYEKNKAYKRFYLKAT